MHHILSSDDIFSHNRLHWVYKIHWAEVFIITVFIHLFNHLQKFVDEIFTRLSAEDIGRFKCLSKNFYRELSSHGFQMMHAFRSGDSLQKKLLSFKDTSIVVDS